MDSQMTFQRYEMKYLLSRKQKEAVLAAMEPYMELDDYGRTTIRNVYYDTDNYRLVRKSLEQPVYKEKLRVRSYGPVEPGDKVFVELKKKYEGVVYKRRIHIPEKAAMDYLAGRREAPEKSQISEEIDYFLQFYRTLEPKVFLSYEREAYYTREPGAFRVTFDEALLWRETDLSLEKGVYGTPLLKQGQTLMEIKTPGNIPLWMVKVLSEEEIRKTSFSKYGNAYTEIYNREKGELIYA
ncbi:MAG: polyphosphate polymerase domain-containing protein [Butyrivibrio sp.]|nr:polyphosphate polymerase domain-containing protein [Acetatifactor muris]MCM1558789.1 polyphosphate polymerase domain-containing protein [Butyrivibrio sp.]